MGANPKEAVHPRPLRPVTRSILRAAVAVGRKVVPERKFQSRPSGTTQARIDHAKPPPEAKHPAPPEPQKQQVNRPPVSALVPMQGKSGPQAPPPLERERTRRTLAEAGKAEAETAKAETKGELEETTPDVFLDVPTVKVDEIKLNVENLGARVALHAELANLVRIDVGADVGIAKVELDIQGVEAQALLKVRLKQVYAILARALDTLDRNPDILRNLLQPAGEAVRHLGREAGRAVGELGTQTGRALGPGGALGETVREVGGTARQALAPEGVVNQAVRDVGETAKDVGKDVGETAKGVTAPQGPVSEAIKGVSEGVDQSVKGETHEIEQNRRYYQEEGRRHEREPAPKEKKTA